MDFEAKPFRGRTLVVSDLHIGADDGRSVVERPAVLDALLAAIDDCERLVLLGDLVELKDSSPRRALRIAEPILRAIGRRAGAERQIIFSPGNHDRGLIAAWIRAQGPGLKTEAVVPHDASSALGSLVAQLGPAQVEVRYPGVWLSDRIWAHHGHYLNRYLTPEQGYGLMLRNKPTWRSQEPAGEHLRPFDFEPRQRARRRYTTGEKAPEGPLQMARPWHAKVHDQILPSRASRLVAPMLGRQMRHHTIPAVVRAANDLGIEPEFLLFGHVHRRGPMAGDWLQEWHLGQTEVLNTGAWRYEPVLVSETRPPHGYWPGGAVVIEADGLPHTVGLLDQFGRTDLLGDGRG